ncbi:MAG: Membrane protease subunit, stomatin/prohibitin [Parcubacteria group bacterium GW2011_GWF2_44_8]|nr:MAG: Membrane protease subunit, stomatin/prohibitin [Parcubacteria group bacterium GW2011_GWF2_44_8]
MYWVILILVLLLLPTVLYVVKGKTAVILETFGRPHQHAVFPGLRIKWPAPITTIVARVNLQLQEIHADVSVKTSDNAFMTLPVKVQYRASDDALGAVKAHYELEAPEKQITSYVLNNVRQTASGMEMTELYANRDAVEQQVQAALSEQFARFGYIIENVLVDEPQPSSEVRDAFNKVIASKRLMEAARNEAEAQRIKLVGAAQAEAESKKLQGEGMAQMREAIARGLEGAMATMTKAGLKTDQALQLLTDTNRIDAITSAAAHGNTIIIDAGANRDMASTAALLDSIKNK